MLLNRAAYQVSQYLISLNKIILNRQTNLKLIQRFLLFNVFVWHRCLSTQDLTCRDENKLIISKAQNERFQCQTNVTIDSWEHIGRGRIQK